MKQKRGRMMVAAVVAVASLALVPVTASALDLAFTNEGGFTGGTAQRTAAGQGGVEAFGLTGFSPTTGPNAGAATYREIGWGCGSATSSNPGGNCAVHNSVALVSPVSGNPVNPADFPENFRSALDVDLFSGNVTVGGDWVAMSSQQHYNRTIGQNAATLTQVDIDTLLTLDTIPSGGGSDSDPGFVRLSFVETINAAPGCPVGGGPNPCADVFTFEVAVFDDIFLTVGGVQYRLEFRLVFPDTTLDERTGGVFANNAGPCVTTPAFNEVCTQENQISEAVVEFRVLAVEVPAPATLLLLGFGLSGLGVAGWLRRR